MSRLRLVFLAVVFCSPMLAAAQQPASTAETTAQATPSSQSSPSNPVLVDRPPAKLAQQRSAVTPEGHIHLDVLVNDTAGKPVLGLGPQEFTLLDNNQPRRILSFHSFDGVMVKPNPPVQVILLVDTVNLPFQQVAFTHQEIAKFLNQNGGHLAQAVSIMLLSDAGLRIQPRPSVDGHALLPVLDEIKGGIRAVYGAMGADGDLQRFQLSLRQMTAIAENEALRPGRKLLIWVGPGWPLLTGDSYRFSDKDQRGYFDAIVELSTKLREARMVVYSVSLSSSDAAGDSRDFVYKDFLKGVPSMLKSDTGNLALKVLVTQSGGLILGPDNNLPEQIDACIADANAFYAISFNAPHTEHSDEYHDLKVQVAQPGATVRTTSGYYNQPEPTAGAVH
jgi:VWFA-related protein